MLMIILSSQIEEEESFELLCHLMYDLGLRKLYKPNMAGLQVSMYQLARLMRYDSKSLPLSLSYNYNRVWLCKCGIFLHFSHFMWDCWLFELGMLMSIPQCNISEIPDTLCQWWQIRFWLDIMGIPVQIHCGLNSQLLVCVFKNPESWIFSTNKPQSVMTEFSNLAVETP